MGLSKLQCAVPPPRGSLRFEQGGFKPASCPLSLARPLKQKHSKAIGTHKEDTKMMESLIKPYENHGFWRKGVQTKTR